VGMIALVAATLAEAKVNIANMALGKSPTGDTALMVLATDTAVPTEVVKGLAAEPGILDVHAVTDV